ncbi:hypothetical protein Droror1_Dr00026555 [Drosera rotundifolia]
MEDDSRGSEVDSIPKVGDLVGNPSLDYSGFYEGEFQFDFEGLEGKEDGRLVMDESKTEAIGGGDCSVRGADGGVGVGVIKESRKKFSGLLESGDDEGTGCLYDKSPGFESPERCITIFNVSDDEGALSKVIKAEETSTSDNDMCNYEDESWGYRWRKGSPEDPYPNRYWIPHDYHGRRLMEINRRAMRPISIEREPEPDKLLKMGKPDKPEKPAFVGAGIKNLEQTCYMNAVLQCVTHTVPFVSSLLLHEEMPECADHPGFCTLCTVRDHIKQSLDFPCKVIFPVTLADNLEQISDTFHKYRQEDAHIFLHCLFEKLDSCWLNHQKSSTTAPEQNNDS